MKENFRPAGTVTEFYGELDSMIKNKRELLVWQTDHQGKRIKINANIITYKTDHWQTLITINSSSLDKLKKRFTFFMYAKEDGFLLKGKFQRQDRDFYVILMDENVFLREKRKTDRFQFQYTKIYTDVLYGEKISFQGLLLKDISEDGYGLLMNEAKSKAFVEGMQLGITKISTIELPRPLNGSIVHKTLTKDKGEERLNIVRLGVKFHKPSKLINHIKKAMQED